MTHMPHWMLTSVLAKYPHLLHGPLDDMEHNTQVKEDVKAVMMKHWQVQGLKMFTYCSSTSRSWMRLRIILMCNKRDLDTGIWLRLLCPGGAMFPAVLGCN